MKTLTNTFSSRRDSQFSTQNREWLWSSSGQINFSALNKKGTDDDWKNHMFLTLSRESSTLYRKWKHDALLFSLEYPSIFQRNSIFQQVMTYPRFPTNIICMLLWRSHFDDFLMKLRFFSKFFTMPFPIFFD